jgi:hypothetical protein
MPPGRPRPAATGVRSRRASLGGSGRGGLVSSLWSVGWGGGEVAVGARASCQPPSWTARWWARHTRARLERSVGPPCSQWRRWWASHQARGALAAGEHLAAVADGQGSSLGGLDDPAAAADLQRLAGGRPGPAGAGSWPSGAVRPGPLCGRGRGGPGGRWGREGDRGRGGRRGPHGGGGRWVAGDQDPGDGPVTSQPPAGLGVQGPLSVSPPRGVRPWRLSRSTVTVSWGRTPPVWGRWPPSRARRANSARASARPWLPLPGSLALVGRVSGSRAASRL